MVNAPRSQPNTYCAVSDLVVLSYSCRKKSEAQTSGRFLPRNFNQKLFACYETLAALNSLLFFFYVLDVSLYIYQLNQATPSLLLISLLPSVTRTRNVQQDRRNASNIISWEMITGNVKESKKSTLCVVEGDICGGQKSFKQSVNSFLRQLCLYFPVKGTMTACVSNHNLLLILNRYRIDVITQILLE